MSGVEKRKQSGGITWSSRKSGYFALTCVYTQIN